MFHKKLTCQAAANFTINVYAFREMQYAKVKYRYLNTCWFFAMFKKCLIDSIRLLTWVVAVVQSLSCVQLFVTPWTAARQASLSFTISLSLLKLMSIESVMPYNHLILCRPLLLLFSIIPSTRIFSNELALLHQVTTILEFQLQHQSFQWIFRTDFL